MKPVDACAVVFPVTVTDVHSADKVAELLNAEFDELVESRPELMDMDFSLAAVLETDPPRFAFVFRPATVPRKDKPWWRRLLP